MAHPQMGSTSVSPLPPDTQPQVVHGMLECDTSQHRTASTFQGQTFDCGKLSPKLAPIIAAPAALGIGLGLNPHLLWAFQNRCLFLICLQLRVSTKQGLCPFKHLFCLLAPHYVSGGGFRTCPDLLERGQIWMGLPRWLSSEASVCQCRRLGVDPQVGKIPCRRKEQPAQVFLPRRFQGQRSLGRQRSVGGQRSLGGYSPWGHRETDVTVTNACIHTH